MVFRRLNFPPDFSIVSIQGDVCPRADALRHIVDKEHKQKRPYNGTLRNPRIDWFQTRLVAPDDNSLLSILQIVDYKLKQNTINTIFTFELVQKDIEVRSIASL